jgi:hypothetical protein
VPFRPQRFDHSVRNRLATTFAFGAVAVGVAVDTPRIPIFLDKRGIGIKRITTLGAEKVSGMPLRAARDDDFALDGRFA